MKHLLMGAASLLLLATAARADGADQVAAGMAVAAAGDCVACHSVEGGKPYAGGRPMQTPLGTIYSTNITPSATGIGGYSFEEFARAVRAGVAKDGHHLYPAMPYPSYARVTDQDMRALYAFFMQGVAPVEQADKPGDIPWPLSMRWPLGLWNVVFAGQPQFTPSPDRDAAWNRGAYLVEGLGHCGSCHTPRGLAFQEKAMSAAGGASYLGGAVIDGWLAKSLRGSAAGLGSWREAELAEFLKTGRNVQTAAFGAMTDVITHSTQFMPQQDVAAIAQYLKALPDDGAPPAPAAAPDTAFSQLRSGDYGRTGAAVYNDFCIGCHRADGAGYARIFPALAGNSALLSADPRSLTRIVLDGGKMARTEPTGAAWLPPFAMPGFAYLSDHDIAAVLSFVRTSWGNAAPEVTADQVAAVRGQAEVAATDRPVGVPASFIAPNDTDIPAGPQGALILQGKRLVTETKRLLPENVGDSLNCTSCHLGGGKVAFASPFVGLAQAYPTYNARAGREVTLRERVNGCFLRSMNGKPLPPQSREMDAIIAYMDWLSAPVAKAGKFDGRGVGKVDAKLVPDPANGRHVYDRACAACHGADGQGLKDARGEYVFPPLWGEDSFNVGAGMARTYTAAPFVLGNMPVGHGLNGRLGQGGALTPQEALDVAEFFTHQPRPDFPPKVGDWPKGGRPADARY